MHPLQQLLNKKGKPTTAASYWSCSHSSVAWAVHWVLDVQRPVCWWPTAEVVVVKIAYFNLGSNLHGLGTIFWWLFGHKIAKGLYSNRGQCRTDNWFWHLCAPGSQCICKLCIPCPWTSWFPVWPGTWTLRGAVMHICSSFFGEKQCVNNSPFIWVAPG